MPEVWKDIKGYEGLYKISNYGNVLSLNYRRSGSAKTLKLKHCPSGYRTIILCKDGIRSDKLIHRLVASAFIPNPLQYPQVNHKDENKFNNNVSNLEWCNEQYNSNYGTGKIRLAESLRRRKWTDEQRKKRSQDMKGLRVGQKHPMFGKSHSFKARDKMSNSRKKSVECVETGEVFDSEKSVREILGISTVGDCCNGKYKTAGGYHWRFT